MRSVLAAVWFLLTASALIGCTGDASSTPKSISQDEQRQMDEAQAKANAEESAHRKNSK